MGAEHSFPGSQGARIFRAVFLYLLFTGLGYAGLSRTPPLQVYQYSFIVVMGIAAFFALLFSLIYEKTKRAVFYLLSGFCSSVFPLVSGFLCLVAVSLGGLTGLGAAAIFMYLILYLVLISSYFLMRVAPEIWKRNLKLKKYDLARGLYYPTIITDYDKPKKTGTWLLEISLFVTGYLLLAALNLKSSWDGRLFILGVGGTVVSYVFVYFSVIGMVYPAFKLVFWELQSKRKCLVQWDEFPGADETPPSGGRQR